MLMPRGPRPQVEVQMLSDYSRNIDVYCAKRGWTIENLCVETGISRNTMGRIRANRHKTIDAEVLTRLCNIFGVSPNELLLRLPDVQY